MNVNLNACLKSSFLSNFPLLFSFCKSLVVLLKTESKGVSLVP